MSVDLRWSRTFLLVLIPVLAILARTEAHANEATGPVGRFLQDPLFSSPARFEQVEQAGQVGQANSGNILPGGSFSVQCNGLTIDALSSHALQSLRLALAVDIALCNHPRSRAALAQVRLEAAGVGEARGAYLPTLQVGMKGVQETKSFALPARARHHADGHNESQFAVLSWRLFEWGGRDATRRRANALLDAALANHEEALQKTLTAVVVAYFEAQTAAARYRATLHTQELAHEVVLAVSRRAAQGAASQSDILQAKTRLMREERDSIRATGALENSMIALASAMGIAPALTKKWNMGLADEGQGVNQGVVSDPYQIPNQTSIQISKGTDPHRDLADWFELAQQHPTLRAARNRLRAARENIAIRRSRGMPALDLTYSHYINGGPDSRRPTPASEESVLALNLTFTLFDGFSRTYQARAAQASSDIAEAELGEADQRVQAELAKAYSDVTAALRSLGSAGRLVGFASEALDSTQRKYDHGATDVLDLLNAQDVLADAQHDQVQADAEWRSARLRLLSSAGVLGRTNAPGP